MFIATLLFRNVLEKGEKVQYVVHRHPVVIQKRMIKAFILGLGLPALLSYMFPFAPMKLFFMAWMIVGGLKILYLCADWYFDAWLITNKNIVVSQWEGFFHREFSRIEYQTIEEVAYKIKGFWGTILNFGEVTVARFGGPKVTVLKKAINPKKVTKAILAIQATFMKDKSIKDVQTLKSILSEMIQMHS